MAQGKDHIMKAANPYEMRGGKPVFNQEEFKRSGRLIRLQGKVGEPERRGDATQQRRVLNRYRITVKNGWGDKSQVIIEAETPEIARAVLRGQRRPEAISDIIKTEQIADTTPQQRADAIARRADALVKRGDAFKKPTTTYETYKDWTIEYYSDWDEEPGKEWAVAFYTKTHGGVPVFPFRNKAEAQAYAHREIDKRTARRK